MPCTSALVGALAPWPMPRTTCQGAVPFTMTWPDDVGPSSPQLGEADYDARLAAYGQLQEAKWAQLPAWHSAPLVHAALADLRNADDIALRHAAAQVCSKPIRKSNAALRSMPSDVH